MGSIELLAQVFDGAAQVILATLIFVMVICNSENTKRFLAHVFKLGRHGVTKDDSSYMVLPMDVIEKKDLLAGVVFVGTEEDCVNWMQENFLNADL